MHPNPRSPVMLRSIPLRVVVSSLACLATLAIAAPAGAEDDGTAAASLALGEALFQERCAACHGAMATGDGPAAAALKVAPPNLTEISARAGGSFPAARIVEVITFGGDIAAHGNGPMPVWGRVFSDEGGRGKIGAARSRQAVIALKRYLESIQK
ncbi:MAG: cytochrome c [Hyphomicrobium sp.]